MDEDAAHRSGAGAVSRRRIGGLAAAVSLILLAPGAFAQTVSLSARSRPVSIAVVGDSLANDLARGMEALYGHRGDIRIIKHTRFATGLVRTDYFDWQDSIRALLGRSNPDVVVVLIGGNDHQQIRTDEARFDPLSEEWVAEYSRRVATFMTPLRKERAKIYWIGLPAVRSPSLSRSYQLMNIIYRREAKRHGFKYVSVWEAFLDRNGAYSSFGQSLNGVKRQLRENDGMHFTEPGRIALAMYVSRAAGIR
jgi:hypothetical protein